MQVQFAFGYVLNELLNWIHDRLNEIQGNFSLIFSFTAHPRLPIGKRDRRRN